MDKQLRVPLSELEKVLPHAFLERLAVPYKIDSKHSIKLSGPLVFTTVLLGLLSGSKIALRSMADIFMDITGKSLDHSALGKRFAKLPIEYFSDILKRVQRHVRDKINARSRGPMSIHLVDATTVTLSAKWLCFGLAVRTRSADKPKTHVKAVYDLHEGLPTFLHLCKDASENADSVALGKTIEDNCYPGELYVFDKGCHGRDRLRKIHEKGAYFLTPHSQQNLTVLRTIWSADPSTLPSAPPGKGDPDYVLVRVEECLFENSSKSDNKRFADMPLAVVHGLRYDTRKKCWKPLVLMTNLPFSADGSKIGPFTWAELAQVYRSRWDIETFFKKLKGHLCYDHLLNRTENGIKIMIYMTLTAAMLMIWVKDLTDNDNGWPSIRFWLERSCRDWVEAIIYSQYHLRDLRCRGT
jgi:hypothetical protein